MSEVNTETREAITEINVEKIMEEIRADIKEKGYTADMLSFQDVAIPTEIPEVWEPDKFEELVNALNMHCNNPFYRPLAGGAGKVFIKRVVRKIVSIVMRPIVEDQQTFNQELAATMNQMRMYIQFQEEKNQELQKEIELLEQKTAALQQK